jgi:micrococcal nuclease
LVSRSDHPGVDRVRRALLAGVAASSVFGGCAPKPDLLAGESGRIVRVSDGDLLYLDTGQAVRLVEIEAPSLRRSGRGPDAFAVSSQQLLSTAALGRTARLYYGGLSRDRYDRALAHVIAQDEIGREVWLNGLMVRQGGARVRTFADNARRARELLALEVAARAAGLGLWADPAYRVLSPADVLGAQPFTLVEGTLLGVSDATGDSLVRIRPTGLELRIGPRLGEIAPGLSLDAAAAIRVRGRIEARPLTGPAIEITHWEQVEIVSPP